jgi:hypothetical protein
MSVPTDPEYVRELERLVVSYREKERGQILQHLPQPQKRRWSMVDWLLLGVLVAIAISLLVAVAPRAIELWLWYQAGKPVAEQQQPTVQPAAQPLPTAYVAPQQPPPRTVPVYQPPPVQQPPPPQAPAQPAPVEPQPMTIDAGIDGDGAHLIIQAPASQPAEQQPIVVVPPPTPLPAPGEQGFTESFQEPAKADTCLFVGCLPAAAPAPTPLPEPGEAGFVESFK